MNVFISIIFLFFSSFLNAQFAPAAGKTGSTAIKYDSICFTEWANSCTVVRGLAQFNLPDSGYASVGNENSAMGAAKQNGVVSLGDGGYATLSFLHPIINGAGWDFAVFENSFLDTFLELAFVEVSTDGVRFVRFPSESATDTISQTGPFGPTHPEKVNNLAGKYIVGFGTPFDLEELKDSAGIDINDVRYVRVKDVIGTIQPGYCSRDSKNRPINDPWPTPFPSSGFDLDAVGVIHMAATFSTKEFNENELSIFPNPSGPTLEFHAKYPVKKLLIYDISGKLIRSFSPLNTEGTLHTELKKGMYIISDPATGFRQIQIIQ